MRESASCGVQTYLEASSQDEVRRLVAESGLAIDEAGLRGSALHEAARRGRTACVQVLCDAHADVNMKDVTCDTPLHCNSPPTSIPGRSRFRAQAD